MGQERAVKVGIVKAKELSVVFHSAYLLNGKSVVGAHVFTLADVGCHFVPQASDASFTLKDVVIGIGFHWERKEEQTFCGELVLMEEDGMLRAVNVVPVETYLTSVISSEMSANASLELLKAHAVISRSWVMRMMESPRAGRLPSLDTDTSQLSTIHIRWYDTQNHTGFDVCADDHCQRYQGITRQSNPQVVKAIEATRGQVLTYEGEICDTRFSKCCGGMTEVFESCWENVHHPYLVAKPDPYCNTHDQRILSQVLNNYDQETHDFYRWTVSYTMAELSALIQKKSGIDFGQILDLVPMERGASGRIITLKVVGEKQTVIVGKELEIRKWLSESHLYSSAFEVEKTTDGFILHGKGWGHGVGLCQIGASVMGDQGIPYTEILSFYYPHAELTNLW
ncbi:MAG: SpoIID/LytB domain-containing protein [Bacteroidaceae bacterium]|nr:SpoIID/LytB domain-containing protein [Bacteroidaceae bacterium]